MCVATTAWIVAGATSAGGLGAFLAFKLKRFVGRQEGEKP
jgi:hypothetical protein